MTCAQGEDGARRDDGDRARPALDGLYVVDCTRGAAGAFATMLLSEHGARVVRVVDGDAGALRDGGFVIWDRGKACVRIDLHAAARAMGARPGAPDGFDACDGPSAAAVTSADAGRGASTGGASTGGKGPGHGPQSGDASRPGDASGSGDIPGPGDGDEARDEQAAAAFSRLLRGADVVVDDFAPDDPREVLFAPDGLEWLNPSLIHASVTGYGRRGPWRHEPAVDDLVLARTGVLGGMPGFRPPPVHVVHPLPSVGAAVQLALGIAGAVLARARDGHPRRVETSLMAGALLYHPKVTGERLDRHVFQTHPSGSAPFYSVYECADGAWLQLGCVHAGFIVTCGRVLGIEATLAEARFAGGRAPVDDAADAELRALLAEVIGAEPLAHWARAFEAADVPFAPARWTEESLDDPQVLHNRMAIELVDPALGPVRQMGVCVALSKTPGQVRGPRQEALPANTLPLDWPSAPAVSAPAPAVIPTPAPAVAPAAIPESPPGGSATLAPPLAGVRVLEITNLIAGPTTGRLLAELGADVVKLEPPGGDMSRPIGRTYFYSVNFNKRSLCLDTGTQAGKEIVQRVAAAADLLVANLRPGATARMGISPELNPRLIETHLTGYGWTGPYAKRPGIDPLAQALMGLERAQGGLENAPVFPAQLAPTDFTTGALGAFGAVLALIARDRDGAAQRVDCNLLNGGIALTSEWFSAYAGRRERPLADREQYGLNPFHRLYRVADGWVYVAADSADARRALRRWLELEAGLDAHPESIEGPHPNDTPLAAAMAARFETLTRDACVAALASVGVATAPALPGDSDVFLGDAHAHAAAMVAEREHAIAGRMRVAWRYVQFGNTRATSGRPTPLLGEHTHDVLADVGFAAADIARFYADGTARTEHPAT